MEDDFEQWLQSQPLNEAVELDGEFVYLKVQAGGAELGVYITRSYTPAQLHDAMRQGFQSAIHFDAGLGEADAGDSLVLTQWLPNVTGWTDAVEPLEKLLNQLATWRAAMNPGKPKPTDKATDNRTEQRLRMLFAGKKQ